MRKVRFNLSTTNKPLSKLIRLVQGIDFSHCSVELYSNKYDVTLIYEAKGFNSYVMNKSFMDGVIVRSYEAEVSEEKYTEVMSYILQDAGTSYAWKTLFGFLYVKAMRMVGSHVSNPWPQKGKVCSESVGEILVRFFDVAPDISYDDMDLLWARDKLKQHHYIKEVPV